MDGVDIIPIARSHVGETYILGARAPLTNGNHHGPWDCAEFVSWCTYRAYGIIFGCYGQNPATADAYSGKWYEDGEARDLLVPVADALATPGAFLVRKPGDFNIGIGHIVISLGDGSVVEARSAQAGVVVSSGAANRPWTSGVHLPGVQYGPGAPIAHNPPANILKLANPYMRGDQVRLVQFALTRRGFQVATNGIYDLITAAAVSNFQLQSGLVIDGEVGPDTARTLGIDWPINVALLGDFGANPGAPQI